MAEYTFFSGTHETVTKIKYILGHKTDLSHLNIEIVQSMFPHHNGIKLKIKIYIWNTLQYLGI